MVSSHGEAFSTALTRISMGFLPVRKLIISNVSLTMLVALAFLPLFLPERIRLLIKRSTMLTFALRNLWCSWRPILCGATIGVKLR